MDRGIMMVALLGQAMPGFWFGLVMIVLFGLRLQWLPISGVDDYAELESGSREYFWNRPHSIG
jgi:ABC-type dipeptide/oligopeptide/nickel transport system permease component